MYLIECMCLVRVHDDKRELVLLKASNLRAIVQLSFLLPAFVFLSRKAWCPSDRKLGARLEQVRNRLGARNARMRDKFACDYSRWFVRTSPTDARTNYRLQKSEVLCKCTYLTLADRSNCVRIPRRRRVGYFLLPVVSVIKSSLLTNESRVECNREFMREMERRG